MGKTTRNLEFLRSIPLSRALLSVVRGNDYSVVLSEDLGCSQQEAVKKLKRLEKLGFLHKILHKKSEGAAVKYDIVWEEVAKAWCNYLECRRTWHPLNFSTEYKDVAPKILRSLLGDVPLDFSGKKDPLDVVSKTMNLYIKNLPNDESFVRFTAYYILAVANLGLDKTLEEFFGSFYNDYVMCHFLLFGIEEDKKSDGLENHVIKFKDKLFEELAPYSAAVSYSTMNDFMAGYLVAYNILYMTKKEKVRSSQSWIHIKIPMMIITQQGVGYYGNVPSKTMKPV